MNGLKQEFKQHSEDVQEILGAIPSWIIRWGITVIFIILILFLIAGYFIKYPDKIESKITLTTVAPPLQVVAQSNGKIRFFVEDNESVSENQNLGIIENPANYEHVMLLKEKLLMFKPIFNNIGDEYLKFEFSKEINLGDFQDTYLEFLKNIDIYNLFLSLDHEDKQKFSLNSRIIYYQSLMIQQSRQENILEKELELAERRFFADSSLFEQKAIALVELERTKGNYLQSKRALQAVYSNILNNKIQISNLENQIINLEIDKIKNQNNLKQNIQSSYNKLLTELSFWEEKYLFVSPTEGILTFSRYWADNQYVIMGEEVMTIIPKLNSIIGIVKMPVLGSGKVKVGQLVNIRFHNYPHHEFGTIWGEIKSISLVPRNNFYTIKVGLTNGLTTSYKKKLEFKQEMQGSAEIITKDQRLLVRVFNQFNQLLDGFN